MPRNLSEADRKKNQFDKEERVHLLAIMKRYAPLLDKSASTLARKKIWTTIEDEFKRAGFTRKTSAQLKKYWQNYKYHCKRATAYGKASLLEPSCRPAEGNQNGGESTPKPNGSDAFIDLSRVKMERNEDEATSTYCNAQESCSLENANFEDDSLEEKKEIFTNEGHVASTTSLANVAECKTKNRIVVSNAKISNNSVTVSVLYPENDGAQISEAANDGMLEARLSCASLPMRRIADAFWSDRTEASCCINSIKGQGVDGKDRAHTAVFDRPDLTECNAGNEEYKTRMSGTNEDQSRERPLGEFLKEDRDLAAMDSEENSCRSVKARNDRLDSRSYVFLTDYHNRLKHRLLLQRLETEEKRLKIKIAEMAIQEVRLRVKALGEDMRRTEELHQVRLARLAAGNVDV